MRSRELSGSPETQPEDLDKVRQEQKLPVPVNSIKQELPLITPCILLQDWGFYCSFSSHQRRQLIERLATLRCQFKLPLERLFAGTGLGIKVRKVKRENRNGMVVEMRLPEALDPSGEVRWLEPPAMRLPSSGPNALITYIGPFYQRSHPEYFDHLDELPPNLQGYKDDFLLMKAQGLLYPFPPYRKRQEKREES